MISIRWIVLRLSRSELDPSVAESGGTGRRTLSISGSRQLALLHSTGLNIFRYLQPTGFVELHMYTEGRLALFPQSLQWHCWHS
jgi:hypothetical protein